MQALCLMELSQVLEQRQTVTPQLILANTLLQLSAVELEQAVAQQLVENPVLELVEVRHCSRCGLAMSGGYCPSCGRLGLYAVEEAGWESDPGASPSAVADDDRDDTWSRVASEITLADHLLRQARLVLPPQDWPIAAALVESLDDRGFLQCELDEVASLFGVDRARIEEILSTVQRLDPVGVAARDVRECLLIQLEHLSREGAEHLLAGRLVRDCWQALATRSLAEAADGVGTTVGEVEDALRFIRENLTPFPAHADWADLHEAPPRREMVYLRPDVVIREKREAADGPPGTAYEIELPGEQAYRLRISASYLEALADPEAKAALTAGRDWEQWGAFYARARLFINSIEQRWRTLYRVTCQLVACQRDFLARGDRYLQPLTRAQLAGRMGVHESTVSRAVAGKYVQLPCGRIIPLARFFESSIPVKEAIKEIIARESRPLSDREIAERLAQQGYRVARRTVAKYRSAMNIQPSSLR